MTSESLDSRPVVPTTWTSSSAAEPLEGDDVDDPFERRDDTSEDGRESASDAADDGSETATDGVEERTELVAY